MLCLVPESGLGQPAPPSSELSSSDRPAIFKSKVNVVLVPVIVRDSQGRAIGGLHKDNFQLFDKGKQQEITDFSAETPGSHLVPLQKNAENSEPAPFAEGQLSVALADHFIAYLFDDLHLNVADLMQVRNAAQRHIQKALRPTDRAAIFTTSGRGNLDFTDDRAKLEEALQRLMPHPVGGSSAMNCPDLSYFQADLIANRNNEQALAAAAMETVVCEHLESIPNASNVATPLARAAAQRVVATGEQEIRLSIGVIRDVVRRMAILPGQRTIVLASPGFFANDIRQEETEIIDRAIRSRVVISSLDARGLYALIPGGDASSRSYSPELTTIKDSYRRAGAMADSAVLEDFARGTGGKYIHDRNDLEQGFNMLAAAPDFIYVLGFSPQNLKLDGSFHALKVTLAGLKGMSLQSRSGYYSPRHLSDAGETAKEEVREAVFSQEELHDLPIELHTQFYKIDENTAKLSVMVHVDIKQMPFRKNGDRNHDNLTIVSGLFDRNGNFLQGLEKILELNLKDETLTRRAGSGITVKTSFDVKPGYYSVRLVVRDSERQMMSASNAAVEIP